MDIKTSMPLMYVSSQYLIHLNF